MERKITVNHVMSSDVHSAIFEAFLSYFNQFKSPNFEHFATIAPDPTADLYHFHRPNLAENIPEKSICTVHHDINDTDPSLQASKFCKAYKRSEVIVCLNSQQEKILHGSFGLKNTVLIPHGVNKLLFDTKQ